MGSLKPPVREQFFLVMHDVGAPREEWTMSWHVDRGEAIELAEEYITESENMGARPIVNLFKLELSL